MTLTLEIIDSAAGMPADKLRHVFGEDGGSIGRGPGSSWVLTHNQVSKKHAQITYRNGVFYIQDTSRNGIAVNTPGNTLDPNRPYALKTGDRIFIEPYQIEVWVDVSRQPDARPSSGDPFAGGDPFAPRRDDSWGARLDPIPGSPVIDEVDPLKFLPDVGGRPPRKADPLVPPADEFLNSHYEPPAPVPSPALRSPDSESGVIPAGYDPLKPEEPAPPPSMRPRPGDAPARRKAKDLGPGDSTIREPAPQPANSGPAPIKAPPPAKAAPATAHAAPRPAGAAADLADVVAGLGLPDTVATPELSKNLGEILRVVVDGLMDILKSRQQIKKEFRMHETMFRPSDNNPLKFSVNLEDALHNLFVKRNPAYLGPVEAFGEAFNDLRDHQLAMLVGMRVAFEAMLADFDADVLQEEFDEQIGKHSLPLVPAKMRYWDLYRERRQAMAKDPEATFARLFGEEFRKTYEEQFRKLKAARRDRKTQRSDVNG